MRPTKTSTVFEVTVEILIVEMLDQFGARHYAAGVMHQVGQQAIFMGGQLDRIAINRDAAGTRVEPDRPANELALGMADRAAQQRAHPCQHFFEMEWLRHVVVGAGVEPLHLVAPTVARREQQDRHGPPCPAPGFKHRNAVHLRQADIQHHRVVRFGLAEVVPLLTVKGTVDNVAGFGQRRRQLPVQVGIVLDNEKTHGVLRHGLGLDRP